MFDSKVDADMVRIAVDAVQPPSLPIVLWDGLGDIAAPAGCLLLPVNRIDMDVLEALPPDATFIYACTQDDIGVPFVRRLHELGFKYHPVNSARPMGYITWNSVARASLEIEYAHQVREGFDKWDFGPGDFIGLIQALDMTSDVEGCFLEVGCFRGSSGGAVLRYLAAKSRSVACHFIDVFTGFDYAEAQASSDTLWANTHATEGVDAVGSRLRSYATLPGGEGLEIHVHQRNVIDEPLPESVLAAGIAVANIDVDLHEAVLSALRKVAPHVAFRGVIVVEDAGHTPLLIGARLALDIFLAEGGREHFVPVVMDSGQTFLIKVS